MSQRDQTQDSELILRVCDCGWSQFATYTELKIHQVDMGCTTRPKVNQQNLSENMEVTNNEEDLLFGVSNLWGEDLGLNVPNLGAEMSQRDPTQDLTWTLGVGNSSVVSTYPDLNSHQANMGGNNPEDLGLNVPNLGATVSQRDPTQDFERILRVCKCGWSKVATYPDLKSHQADMSCTPRSEVNNQQKLFEIVALPNNPEDLALNVPNLGAAMSQRDSTQDVSQTLRVGNLSVVSTYPGLNSHQGDIGGTTRPKVKQSNQQNLALPNNKDDLKMQVPNPGAANKAQAGPSQTPSLEQQLTCPICMSLFVDPVTTTCGHTFCKGCLDLNCQSNDRLCPLCKQIVRRTPEVNIVMRSIAEEMKKIQQKLALAPGEVACDICTEPKLKAEKSCLVCLASYCSTHLEKHSSTKRLKGHKLVEPVENLDERACLEHGRPLELYSRKTEKCICARCLEEGQEEVVSTEDEWNQKKTKLQNTKQDLQEKIKKRKKRVVEVDESLKSCKDQLDNEWWDIDAVFTTVNSIMEEAHANALKPLTERREVLEKDAKDIKDALEAEIDRLEKTISELDDISALEDHILFLQRFPSLRDPDDHKDSTKIKLDTSLSFGTMRKTTTAMLERIQQEVETLASTELQRIPKFAVDVKLDPTTAHPRLVLSDDGKQVSDGGDDQEVDDSPERFDLFASILGVNRLTSGRSYWEVEVSNKMGWDLGVTTGDANRKGKLTLKPDNGYWVIVHYEDDKFAALTAPPVRLCLGKKPQKVGVFVDYEEGLVSFYNVMARSHIYTFTNCSFGDDLFPYFSPHAKKDEENSDPLIISDL